MKTAIIHHPVYERHDTGEGHPESPERYAVVMGALRGDADTIVSMDSLDAALRAAGGACRAVDAVMSGEVDNAFLPARPPGHHATPERAMGFCLFNTVAVAARYAQNRHRE